MEDRIIACRILLAVLIQGEKLDVALAKQPNLPPLSQAISYGVCRFYNRLLGLAQTLLPKPFKTKDHDILMLLLIGLYQLAYMNIPSHAAVNETVQSCLKLRKPWAKRVLNATLRRFQREQNDLIHKVDINPALRLAHPEWLWQLLQHDWPFAAETIALQNNQHPPLTVRLNIRRESREHYLQTNPNTRAVTNIASAVIFDEPKSVTQLPGFTSGYVSVQDASAQLAAFLLPLAPNLRVLDACAAPGGKCSHLLEVEPSLAVTAIDISLGRIAKIESNLRRCGLHATLFCGNSLAPAAWWDKRCFDRILLDAPCSGTGVIRRHPDIKWHRSLENIERLAQQQLQLLHSLWPLLKSSGFLLYATCSVLRQENESVIAQFLQTTPDCKPTPIEWQTNTNTQFGIQILPSSDMDGFYYCLLHKQ